MSTTTSSTTTHEFRAETRKVLNILTHSLYTNREIFLRELLSNASDALDKLRFLQRKGESLRNPDLALDIHISADKLTNVLTVTDTGVGMTDSELMENLGVIAHSGSENFLADLPAEADKSDAAQIIGRFGIGFYSVFMVADKVEVISLPATGESVPHIWTSDGSGTYTVSPATPENLPSELADKEWQRGTTIRVHMKKDAEEFLAKYRLEAIIRSHSNFLPFPIYVEDDLINTTAALWREPKFSITKEQYNEFYKFLTHDAKEPLDCIHLTVDAPVQFNALLFIPDSTQDYFGEYRDQWGLDLFVRRVLIQHSNQELIPNYLAFLKGVVDTEDLPLNISRETLQENIVIRKIAQTILKQVFTHLERMATDHPETYTKFWNLHGRYFKFAFNDYPNRDRITPLLRFKSSALENAPEAEQLTSLDAYLARMKPDQKEIWYVSAPSLEAAKVNPHLERFRMKGVEVLYMVDTIDEFALESLANFKDHPFKSVEQATAADLQNLPDVVEKPTVTPLTEEENTSFTSLLDFIRATLGDQITDVRVSDRLTGSPACLSSPDGVTSSMEKFLRVMQKDEGIPKKIFEINPDHPLVRALIRIHKADAADPTLKELVLSLFDTTLLMDGYLNDPFTMANRSLKLLEQSGTWYADLRHL